jgi:glycosyltransferase involved in cell wall biosynthesis
MANTKLLGFPNDSMKSYFRSSRDEFLGEFNPMFEGHRRFDEVGFLNWRDDEDVDYHGISSKAIISDSKRVSDLYSRLCSGEISFDSPDGSFRDLLEDHAEEIGESVNEFNPSLMRAFNTHFATELGLVARSYSGAPLMVSAHDPTRLTPALSEVDALVCESHELRRLCIENFSVDPGRISVIHNGIDMDYFYPNSDSEISDVVPKEFLDAKYKVFSSSRLVRGKNIEVLLRAISTVRGELPGLIHLHLGDDGGQPSKAAEIYRAQEELGLKNTSYFLGSKSKSELPAYYSWADVFVLPTLWEGLSRVMRESLACGTPVIATDYGSSSEIVRSGYNGVSIDPNSVDEIADSMVRVLKDNKLRKGLEKNARGSVAKYSSEKSMKSYSALYDKLLTAG